MILFALQFCTGWFEKLGIVLAERRRGAVNRSWRLRQPHAVAHEIDVAAPRVRQAHSHAERLHLWITEHFGEIVDGAGGHVLGLKEPQPMRAGIAAKD